MFTSRSEGITPSERKLAEIAERTFLDLWSYPNTYIDRKQNGRGSGNEFCDLLVVCGEDVIIFSDKSVNWPEVEDIDLAWSRWYRRAVRKSVDQIRGAASWIQKFPNKVFLDKECTKRLPIEFPDKDRIRIHGIAVAVGANNACCDFFDDAVGTFPLRPSLKDNDHINKNYPFYTPFCIGDTDTSGPFVHVFDERSLDILFHELTTITDFVDYLIKRADLIRSDKLIFAPGEEDLVAHYLRYIGPSGNHDFTIGDRKLLSKNDFIAIADGTYEAFIKNQQYRDKRKADEVSYLWDNIISQFTKHILAGTSISIDENPPSGFASEMGLRIMARENRVSRRLLSLVFKDAFETASKQKKDRYFRLFMPLSSTHNLDTAYFLMLLSYADFFEENGGYPAYRSARAAFLEGYAYAIRYKYPKYKHIIGIGFDLPSDQFKKFGASQDIVYLGDIEWTNELTNHVEKMKNEFGIFTDEPKQYFRGSIDEYPDGMVNAFAVGNLSRQQKRLLERQARKRKDRT